MNRYGEEEATRLGFTIYCHSANSNHVTYVDDYGIFLDVYESSTGEMRCKLQTNYKMLTISTGELSFQHKNFSMFYKQIVVAKSALED